MTTNTIDFSEAKRDEAIQRRLKAIPKLYKPVYQRAVKGKSLRACINAQCLECVMWVRNEITLCTDTACPLWAVRPYQTPEEQLEEPTVSLQSPVMAELAP